MPRVANAEIRDKIVEAARERLWHYGFRKTTIDEIAADAGVGKGTVYLYFDSKEDIALAIMTDFKLRSLEQVRLIASTLDKDPVQKLAEMLLHPIVAAHERCRQSPAALEMIVAVRPHLQSRLKVYLDEEIRLIADVLDEGQRSGTFKVDDSLLIARTLKCMCAGFWPPYPCIEGLEAIREEVARMVQLVYEGLRA